MVTTLCKTPSFKKLGIPSNGCQFIAGLRYRDKQKYTQSGLREKVEKVGVGTDNDSLGIVFTSGVDTDNDSLGIAFTSLLFN